MSCRIIRHTLWYQGPKERFGPLYQFVRHHTQLFDDYSSQADLGVVLSHRSFVKNRESWFSACSKLAAANVSYRLLVAGDELVDHPLPVNELKNTRKLLLLEPLDLDLADRQLLEREGMNSTVYHTPEEAVAAVDPAVRVESNGTIRVLPRVKPGSAVVHLLNHAYDPAKDEVSSTQNIRLRVRLDALGLTDDCSCRLFAPGNQPLDLKTDKGRVLVPGLGLWAVLLFQEKR